MIKILPKLLWIIVAIGLIIMTKWTYDDINKRFDEVVDYITKPYEKMNERLVECAKNNQYNKFYETLQSIDRTRYNKDLNNCFDYSKRLKKKLADNNIASSIMIRSDRNHAWICVWIEATTGEFIPSNIGYKILELR